MDVLRLIYKSPVVPTTFITGFPGFLASRLVPRLLARRPDARVRCLVQPKFAALARSRATDPRVEIVEGDITSPLHFETTDIDEVFHFAAVYDLGVKREIGMRVNVEGTRNVLDFAERCASLKRLHYISTCYVSGRHPGVFRETDLEKNQTFNNYYEETKFLAEVEVQQRMRNGMPVTIYRPSVVVGDSTTGETQKYDGPYFVMQWLLRQPRVAMLPVLFRPTRYTFNVVPRDFVIDAIDRLSAMPESSNKVYQLADPDPMTIDQTIDAIAAATNRKVVRIPLPRVIAKGALDYVPGVYRLMRIPSAAVDYFAHPTSYDTTNTTRDLGVTPPRFRDYLPRLVDFVRAHPEIGAAPMI